MFSRRTTSLVMLGHLFAAVEHHDQFWASGHELFTEKWLVARPAHGVPIHRNAKETPEKPKVQAFLQPSSR